jgi:mannose-1-phosphate guanylyltransferase
LSAAIVPVILAGGQGTRLWPYSRTERPKQFLPWMGGNSLFQRTLLRVEKDRYRPPMVVTHADYHGFVTEGAATLGHALGSVLLEPVARNTGPAIAAAAEHAIQQFGEDVVIQILPSDHQVEVGRAYWEANDLAQEAAHRNKLVAFGINPTGPETGYGYIKAKARPGGPAVSIERFVEKPTLDRASAMLSKGGHFWNSGMFMFKARTFLDECAAIAPEILEATLKAVRKATSVTGAVVLDAEEFGQAPDISVDYAIFERTKKAVVVAAAHSWTDLGTWEGVWQTGQHDAGKNFTQGPVTLDEVQGSLVVTDDIHVAVYGLSDIAVIATPDAVFVTKRSLAQKVSTIVKRLRENSNTRVLTQVQQTAYRPWGNFTSLARGQRYQVKRIFVKPGQKLSLQKHHHRAEHWIIVGGTAEVLIDGVISLLTENQSIYLPVGCVHRLSNPGKIDLELIEVQTGAYVGEDDIVRIEDEYGRT